MTDHTPTPWEYGGETDDPEEPNPHVVESHDGFTIGRFHHEKDAHNVVRAVNAFPDLVVALRAIIARKQGVYDDPALMTFGALNVDVDADILRIAETALAKVEGRA